MSYDFVRSAKAGRFWLAALLAALLMSLPARAHAAPKQGDGLQTDSLSMLLVNRDYTAHRTTSLKDAVNLSGIVGLHYYFIDRVRIGMGLQYTERLWPNPPPGSSRWQRFAFMPQIGWSFYDPFYTALLLSYAPRTQGRAEPDLAIIGALGAAFPVTKRMKLSLAVEVPYAFLYHRTLGLVGLTGVSFRL
ncbi:MAG TPA: hypothetical protein VEQ59_19685 [Polyangiaceae bacterium]|nr:hypothetical protein [Polyangiaceae bacterium]